MAGVRTINVATVAAALQYGDVDGVVRPFLAAAELKLGSRVCRRAGVKADGAKPAAAAGAFGTINMRSVIDWVASIDPSKAEQKANVDALCSLTATAKARMGVAPNAAKTPPAPAPVPAPAVKAAKK